MHVPRINQDHSDMAVSEAFSDKKFMDHAFVVSDQDRGAEARVH